MISLPVYLFLKRAVENTYGSMYIYYTVLTRCETDSRYFGRIPNTMAHIRQAAKPNIRPCCQTLEAERVKQKILVEYVKNTYDESSYSGGLSLTPENLR